MRQSQKRHSMSQYVTCALHLALTHSCRTNLNYVAGDALYGHDILWILLFHALIQDPNGKFHDHPSGHRQIYNSI